MGVGAAKGGEAGTGVVSGRLCFCVAGALFFAAEPFVKGRVPAAGLISSTASSLQSSQHTQMLCEHGRLAIQIGLSRLPVDLRGLTKVEHMGSHTMGLLRKGIRGRHTFQLCVAFAQPPVHFSCCTQLLGLLQCLLGSLVLFLMEQCYSACQAGQISGHECTACEGDQWVMADAVRLMLASSQTCIIKAWEPRTHPFLR